MCFNFFLILLALPIFSFSQELNRQMIASQGSTIETNTGYYVSQSVGQLSVIGRGTHQDLDLLQGFQQPIFARSINSLESPVNVILFPVPTNDNLTIYLSNYTEPTIEVFVYDIIGKLVKNTTLNLLNNSSTLELNSFSSGTYIIQLRGNNILHYSQILKN